jgi:uncharacterized protein YndB with AHSA1/START domain
MAPVATTEDLADPGTLMVRLRRLILASPERVWQIISSSEGMQDWLGPRTFEPQLGGRVLFDVLHGQRPDGAPQRWLMFGNIVVWELQHELAFTWQELDVAGLTVWPAPTVVSIAIEPANGSTLVTLSHGGFERLPDGLAQFEGYRQGWSSLNDLEALARMCETGA